MVDQTFLSKQNDLEGMIRRLVAEQLAMDPFEVKLTDRIDEDPGVAGLDVVKLLYRIAKEFGTDFGELDEVWDDYFYPEVADSVTALNYISSGCSGSCRRNSSRLRAKSVHMGTDCIICCCATCRMVGCP